MNRLKRVLCLVLVMVLLGSMVPMRASASGDIIPVQLLTSGDTVIVKAGGAVAQGGSVSCLGTTVSTAGTLQYGYALEAASASGDLIECMVGLPAVTKIS